MEVLDEAADGIYKKLKAAGGNPDNLPEVLRPIAILYQIQAMIDNGGIRYPLENDLPFQLPYSRISEAYRDIGAKEAADTFDKAIALFPFPFPERLQQAREDYMNSLEEDSEFFQLGDSLCGDASIWQRMTEYVKRHAYDFEIPQA